MTSTRDTRSLLAGRSSAPLDEGDIRRAVGTLVGLDDQVPYRPEPDGHTRFVIEDDGTGHDYGIVVIGSDVYPGLGMADPNSALSMQTALAHEIVHFHRWLNHTELPLGVHTHLDEAMTSLEAVLRFPRLSPHEAQTLVRDALFRLSQHWAELEAAQPRP
ncbi:MAG: hypothetical protein JWR04_354 [Rhodoglobus sp.]|nr:hypothetical protein [Rhodoglobus sp.]